MNTDTFTFITTYQYTLSALLQGFAALITLVGMFIIFRLQANRGEVSEATKELLHSRTLKYSYSSNADAVFVRLSNLSSNDLLKKCEEAVSGDINDDQKQLIKQKITNLKECMGRKEKIISKIWLPLILSGSVVACSMWFLSFTYRMPVLFLNKILYLSLAIASVALLDTIIVIIQILYLGGEKLKGNN